MNLSDVKCQYFLVRRFLKLSYKFCHLVLELYFAKKFTLKKLRINSNTFKVTETKII